MRIAVIGTSGSGKSTMAKHLSAALAIPYIEIDAINFQGAGFRDLNTHEPEEFKRRLADALAPDAWVMDGNFGSNSGPVMIRRTTHIVWLDYDRPLVMRRVIWRSFIRAASRKELWPGTGNRETFRQWFKDPDHPIRWAWRTHERRRKQYEALIADPRSARLKIIRLRHPREANDIVARLS